MLEQLIGTIEKKVNKQLAHIFASYGDQPEEFMNKLFDLVVEWYCKGLESGILAERKHKEKPID